MLDEQTRVTIAQPFDEETVRDLQARLCGPVLRPGEAEYEAARALQNGLIDRHPALIVRCSGVADVIEVVNFVRQHGVLVSVRGGGHNVAGNALCDGGVVIDLSLIRGVHVNPTERTVRVGGGATWADVDRETQVFGLATTGGNVSTTGVGGLTLHGGMGHLRRLYGLSIDNLLSVDIVTADGQLRTASATENEDLFWAVRGAGSNFGVVTSLEFRLHPVGPQVVFCAPFYALEDAPRLLPAWRDFMASAPEEFSGLAALWSIPALPAFPEELHGRGVCILAGVYNGPIEAGLQAIQPLRELATPLIDMTGPMPYTVAQSAFDPFLPKGSLYYWKSIYLNELNDEAIAAIVRYGETRPAPEALIGLWHHGGATNRVRLTDTPFYHRQAPYLLSFDTTWNDPTATEHCINWTREAWAMMQRFSPAGGLYLNFAGFGEEKEDLLRAAYGPNYDRLVELKTKYDPGNLFRVNLNIKPGS